VKRLVLVLAIAVTAALLLFPGIAFANFAIHGGYAMDTDACAGCHRAHTSISSVTWADNTPAANTHSALLVSNATQIYEFCYACHDDSGQGADTNVQSGIYDGSLYGTHNAALNGGGFDAVGGDLTKPITSTHMIAGSWGAYGGGQSSMGTVGATGDIIGQQVGAGNTIEMTCASCHDPHGSSNYRLLKDVVNGNTVGGYPDGVNPAPFVSSDETGYPNGTDGTIVGWLKHDAGHAQMVGYTPNYTTPMYAKPTTSAASPGAPDPLQGMSGWCAGCHSVYLETGTPHSFETSYNANDGWGFGSRHRHPINISISVGYGGSAAGQTLTASLTPAPNIPLPLAHPAGHGSGVATNTSTDWIDCMTCHVAHGTSSVMTGWANVADATNLQPNSGTIVNGSGGVQPTGDSALLRLSQRGVCEVCHNK
jgi:hypothetical protein